MSEPERIDVNTFADLVGRSKRQIYKHIKSGRIPAVKPNANTAYQIERSEVDLFIAEFGGPGSLDDTANRRDQARTDTDDSSHRVTTVHEQSRTAVNPPAEVYALMLDRLTRAERRAVELELTLRQHQTLLTEHAESLQENRAEVLESEAVLKEEVERRTEAEELAELAQREAAQAKIELETLKTELRDKEQAWAEARKPWWKKMFAQKSG